MGIESRGAEPSAMERTPRDGMGAPEMIAHTRCTSALTNDFGDVVGCWNDGYPARLRNPRGCGSVSAYWP